MKLKSISSVFETVYISFSFFTVCIKTDFCKLSPETSSETFEMHGACQKSCCGHFHVALLLMTSLLMLT